MTTRAHVSGNAIEVSLSFGDVLLFALSILMVAGLTLLAGWQIAFVALGVSLAGAGIVDVIQALEGGSKEG